MPPEKTDIRRRMLRRRRALSPSEAREKGEAAGNRLLRTDLYQQARCLNTYLSVHNEMDTHRIIQAALDAGRRLAVPVVQKGRKLVHVELQSLSSLVPAPFGLLEPPPENRIEIPPEAFDLVLVPGLAFDRQGNRIGFGAGYYDRFLACVTAPKVGLAYDFQILDRLPAEPHDIPLDFLVTDKTFYPCERSN